ncbi:MAG TPA: adenylate/guanylate cyclase domain-containing protein [Pyrinomonadaceae bacterium]|jgi:class 3 adenylate cyclase
MDTENDPQSTNEEQPVAEEQDAKMKLAHVLFMDIVSYSVLPTDQQSKVLKTLQEIVRGTAEVQRAQALNQLISLATGDGMALVFFNDPMAPVQCALEISKALKGHPEVKLRMGVHSGPVNEIVDVNERLNVAGSGINMAQRVMDSGDAGHILLSRRVAEDLGQYSSWQPFLHDLKEVEVKHGVRVHVFNLYTGEVGNAALPQKVRKRKKKSVVRPVVALAVASILLFGIGFFVLRGRETSLFAPAAKPLRPEAEFKAVLQKKIDAWTEGAFAAQVANGGLKSVTAGAQTTTQAWTTAQALVALLSSQKSLDSQVPKIKAAFEFIEKLRRANPSEGWNYYGNANPFTVTEINSWVTLAHLKSLDSPTPIWSDAERADVVNRIVRDLEELARRQDGGGGWRPITEDNPDYVRTYSTVIAVWTFAEASQSPAVRERTGNKYDQAVRRAVSWLLQNYKLGQGWVQNPQRTGQKDRFDGLTAQALFALSRAESIPELAYLKNDQTYRNARKDFINNKELAAKSNEKDNSSIPDADVHFAGSEFMSEGSTFLWFPWSLLALTQLSQDKSLTEEERKAASQLRLEILNANAERFDQYVETANLTYLLAENLFCVNMYLKSEQ